MANEITATAALAFSKNGMSDSFAQVLKTFTLTGAKCVHNVQSIGSSEEALAVGEIASAGWAIFYNTGKKSDGTTVTDTISLRPSSGAAAFHTLPAGGFAMGPLAAATPYAIASSTNAPMLEYMILEA